MDPSLYLNPEMDRNLRRVLVLCGLMEIGLFGLPLIAAGRWIGRYVRCYDPHIYKEYGVARIVLGALFLLGATRREARAGAATVGALFYALNLFTSIVDMVLGNVARIELAVALLSAGLAAWLHRSSRRGAGAQVPGGALNPDARIGRRPQPRTATTR